MKSGALRIALIYLAVSLAWIFVSDRMLTVYQHFLSPAWFIIFNNSRRFVFLSVTGYLLYRMIRANEKKLIESERHSRIRDDENRKLGNIITKVNNLIIITDKNNYISWVNKAFEDFTGYTFDEVAGYTPATFFIDGESGIDELSVILGHKKVREAFSTEVNCRKKNGEKFCVHSEYTPLFDDSNVFTGYIGVYNDITGLKQKQIEAGRQIEKLKEVAWLSSHEVRRPLANIIGLTNLMKVTPLMDEKIRILESINRSADELDKIIHVVNSTVGTELENAPPPAPTS
ncbi:PAS domain-containing protein [Mucilaginibacter sp.]|jgi:PAS domain S-box-containing protein|uniref:PAS domain-containing protein n=1 Tax=Mucilaginibacter sp. TaxID=1882438 RepID=UPI002CD1EA6F|nr:PAS domain-containing protein [Mucilaginibacter sp.]HTI61508.1 PAS domain-containing protein [Mucilaginibacter sp.]